MESQWIMEKIKKLKRLHCECGTEEIALSRYISCMIRMLNGLAQMEYAQFHFYEKLIIQDALKIFTEHFIEQIEVAKSELNVLEKRELIDDIENSVDQISSVYKNVIDSMANSDRQMLSSISIDTSIYELSPKICAFYSLVLNRLVKMFEEDRGNYVFVLHPTLKNNTETKIMFERRKKAGKVVIIYISESIIEMFDVVSVFILHEAFHVLTRKERMRKKRIKAFIQLMLAGMKQILFRDVVFDDDRKRNEKIENQLLQLFFSDCPKEAKQWESDEEDSRNFYSSEVKQWGILYFQHRFISINDSLEKWVRDILRGDIRGKNYGEFRKSCDKEDQIIKQIKANLLKAIFENQASFLSERFLFICRETYADIACILTLQLKPEDYNNAFEKSKQFRFDERYYDSTRTFRNYIVALSVANHMPSEEHKLWKEFAEKLRCEFYLKNNTTYCEKNSTFSQSCVMLDITPQMQQALQEYAQECAKAFSNRIESIQDISSFRKYMVSVRNKDKIKLLKDIMTGKYDVILDI